MHHPRARCTVGLEVGDESVPSDSCPALLAKGRASEWLHLLSARPSLVPLEKDVPYGGCRGGGGAVSCAQVFLPRPRLLPILPARPSCCAEPVGAKRARPPPPPDMAAAPKPGMIAEIGGSPAVKNLALRYAFGSCPIVQSVQENAGCSLFPPSWSSPAFLLPASGPMLSGPSERPDLTCR
jgi:hypothetical protein